MAETASGFVWGFLVLAGMMGLLHLADRSPAVEEPADPRVPAGRMS